MVGSFLNSPAMFWSCEGYELSADRRWLYTYPLK